MGAPIIRKLPPSEPLIPFIKYYLYLEMDYVGKFRVVSSPEIEMYFVFRPAKVVTRNRTLLLPKVLLGGIQDLYHDDVSHMYDTSVKKGFVVVFRPSAMYQLFGVKLSELANYIVHADELIGKQVLNLWDRLLVLRDPHQMKISADYFFSRFLPARFENDGLTDAAIGLMDANKGMVRQGTICKKLNSSSRKLQRRFKEHIGCTIKELLQIYRFNFMLKNIDQFSYSQLTQLSYQCDYFDQSHFIKDFKRVTGQVPKAFVANEKKLSLLSVDNRKFFKSRD